MITGPVPPTALPSTTLLFARFLARKGLPPRVPITGGLSALTPGPEPGTANLLVAEVVTLDLTATAAAYAEHGAGRVFHELLQRAGRAAHPTHVFLTPTEAQQWITRLENTEWVPDDLADEPVTSQYAPIATVNTQAPTPEHLPDHLRDHAQRITALTDFAHRCAYDTDHLETVLHAVVLTRPEDRAAMTALRDYLDLFAEDSTITVPFEDLTCVHATAQAGKALLKALSTPPKP